MGKKTVGLLILLMLVVSGVSMLAHADGGTVVTGPFTVKYGINRGNPSQFILSVDGAGNNYGPLAGYVTVKGNNGAVNVYCDTKGDYDEHKVNRDCRDTVASLGGPGPSPSPSPSPSSTPSPSAAP